MDRYFHSSVLPPPHQHTLIVVALYMFVPAPNLLSRHEAPLTWLFPIWFQLTICVCVCNRPLVREVCTNDEVVMFQPRAVTPPYLGSVAIILNLI